MIAMAWRQNKLYLLNVRNEEQLYCKTVDYSKGNFTRCGCVARTSRH